MPKISVWPFLTPLLYTGTEEVPVKDENGDQVWKTADTDRSHVRYEPEYGPDGRITGQHPMSRTEPQILRAEHVPQTPVMGLTDLELDETEPMLREKASMPPKLHWGCSAYHKRIFSNTAAISASGPRPSRERVVTAAP